MEGNDGVTKTDLDIPIQQKQNRKLTVKKDRLINIGECIKWETGTLLFNLEKSKKKKPKKLK